MKPKSKRQRDQMIDGVLCRVCSHCKRLKPLDDKHFNTKQASGEYFNGCRDCNEYNAQRFHKSKNKRCASCREWVLGHNRVPKKGGGYLSVCCKCLESRRRYDAELSRPKSNEWVLARSEAKYHKG